jgi:CDP-2,3-bis-(O-geranylgeranyl)-sn-glycerol synthase
MVPPILEAIWYIFPAYMANNSPVFAKKIFRDRFDSPIDGGKRFMGRPLFGKNKTWRGLFSGIVMGIIIVYLQCYLFQFQPFRDISVIDYSMINPVAFGLLMGFGALFGDLAKSFLKRRIGIAPGKSWIPFDQIDFLVGSMLISSIAFAPELLTVITVLIIMPLVKIFIDQVGFFLKINESRF